MKQSRSTSMMLATLLVAALSISCGQENATELTERNSTLSQERNGDNRARHALLVVGKHQSGEAKDADHILSKRLERLGFKVTRLSDHSARAENAKHVDLVVISDSVSSRIGATFRDVEVPAIVLDEELLDDMRMTGSTENRDFGTVPNQAQLAILDPTHLLANGMSGLIEVTGSGQPFNWGRPGPAAAVVASIVGQPSHATVFGYELGTQMIDLAAPARRVGWFAAASVPKKLNSTGLGLFDAAVRWAVEVNTTAVAARVLGFERARDWSVVRGHATLAPSRDVSQGLSSLAVSARNDVAVRSIRIASPLSVGPFVSMDIFLCREPPALSTRVEMTFDAPSQGIRQRSLGQRRLSVRPSSGWNELTFDVPGDLQQKLNRTFDDLRITITIKDPPSCTFQIDNIVLNAIPEVPQLSSQIFPPSGPTFSGAAEASLSLKASIEAARLGIATLDFDSEGSVRGLMVNRSSNPIDFVSVVMLDGSVQQIDRFSLVLGGLQGVITVAGKRICLRDSGCACVNGTIADGQCQCPEGSVLDNGECFGPVEAASAAVPGSSTDCTGGGAFCTGSNSFQTNLFIYRSIGGATRVTSPIPRATVACEAIGELPDVLSGLLGPSLSICSCPSIDTTVFCDVPIGATMNVTVEHKRSFALTLATSYFVEDQSNSVITGRQDVKSVRDVSIENKLSAWFVGIKLTTGGRPAGGGGVCSAGAAECTVRGTCSRHNSRDQRNLVLSAVTASGRIDQVVCQPL